jgi:hypothetical protein
MDVTGQEPIATVPTCWNSWEMTCWKRSMTSGLGGWGPWPAQICWEFFDENSTLHQPLYTVQTFNAAQGNDNTLTSRPKIHHLMTQRRNHAYYEVWMKRLGHWCKTREIGTFS